MTHQPQMTVLEDQPARFTSTEFIEMMESGPLSRWPGKTELVRGVIVRMAPAHIPHWNAQRVAFIRLYEILKEMPGFIVGQEPTVRLTGDTVREPDVAVLRETGLVGEVFDRTALFLAVEIADSSLAIDLHAKRLTYAEAFVPYYWVIDINGRVTTCMSEPLKGDYRIRNSVPFGQPLPVPGTDRTIVIE